MENEITPEKLRAMADEMEQGKVVTLKEATDRALHDLTVTVDGVTVTVDSRMLDDVEILFALQRISKMDENNPDGAAVMEVLEVIQKLVGEEGSKAVVARLREKNGGFAPSGKYIEFLMNIFAQLQQLKN